LIKKYQLEVFVFCYIYPKDCFSGYVQGINDLLTPFFYVFLSEEVADEDIYYRDLSLLDDEILFTIEADCYWCLSKLLGRIHDNYTISQPGIQRKINKLFALIKVVDESLHQHLERFGVDYLDFSFRWMNCLLIRELPFPCVARMFDTYLAETENFIELHLYICGAFLVRWSNEIKKETDFHNIITLLQNLKPRTARWSESEMELLLAQAYVWKSLYQKSHLQNSWPEISFNKI
jgi:hypothetical protein